ncbi:ARPP-1 family domain-containing protein [Chloroflexota bacterium]
MDAIITNHLSKLEFGDIQTFKNMAILPLFLPKNGGPNYLTLKEALAKDFVTITEVDQAGSVPDLKITNESGQPVLLLDGEEIIGAKQNRVLSTSILLKDHSETTIPVSCTERGRWHYTSERFSHSDVIMSHKARYMQQASVYDSLHKGRGHRSDQGRVWFDIEEMHEKTATTSPTRAMKDVYAAKDKDLQGYLQTFASVPHQQGCLVFINGKIVGLDVVSDHAAYETVHAQFVKSYAMEALLEKDDEAEAGPVDKAETFLQEAQRTQESRFEAVGQGHDYRFEGENVMGSALVHDGHVIHLAFFKNRAD